MQAEPDSAAEPALRRDVQVTQGLLLADYLKSILTGQNLPPDLGFGVICNDWSGRPACSALDEMPKT